MHRSKATGALILVGALAVVGCGESSSGGAGGSGGTGGFAGTGGTGGTAPTVTVEFTVIDFQPGEPNIPFEGAEVCVLDSSNCATSDVDGLATLEVPANSDTGFTVIAEGYTPTIAPQTTGDQDLTTLTAILSDTLASTLAALLNTPYPPVGTGLVALSALVAPITDDENGIPGVTFTADSTASSYYLDENEFPSLDLTETTAPSGAGGYIEIAPGTLEVALGGAASNCIVVSGWAGSDADSLRVPIREGFFTQAFITCDPIAP